MVRLVNRAKMTTATTGTGTVSLGVASEGFQTFAGAGVVDGDLVRYVIEEGDNFEIGTGVFGSAGGTLTRNPSESSAGGGAITLAGDALVFLTAASADIQRPPAEGPFVDGDKTKLDGIAAGAQVNVATNLSVTAGTTAGPTINSSTGASVTFPTASGTASGAVTTGAQTWAGIKTFGTAIAISGTSKAAGHLYAGTTNPSNTTRLNYDGALHVNTLTAVGDVTAFSDIRLKQDLKVIPDALAKVRSLTGYTYMRIDTGDRQTGVVAQDVQKVLPEAVNDTGEHLSVAYGNMVGLLIQAIKEQQAQIDGLKARLES